MILDLFHVSGKLHSLYSFYIEVTGESNTEESHIFNICIEISLSFH